MVKWTWAVAAILAMTAMGCGQKRKWHPAGFPGYEDGGDTSAEDAKPTFPPEFHFDQGMAYYGAGKLDEGEKQFLMAVQQKKDYAEAWNALGYTYHCKAFLQINARKSKEAIALHNQALDCFNKALETKPKMTEALVGLSLVNYDEYYYFSPHNRDYRLRAMSYLDRAQKIAPNNPNVQANVAFNRAKLFLLEKGYDDAIPDLEKVVAAQKVEPVMLAQAHFMLGGCYAVAKRNDAAIQQYRAYLELLPNAPNADEVNDIIVRIQRSQNDDHPVELGQGREGN